jgi:CcmD family protein
MQEGLNFVLGVNLIIWFGIAFYLFILDRRIRRLENTSMIKKYEAIIFHTPDLVERGNVLKELTTETQRPQRRWIFPWPGDDGQGKEPPPSAKTL